MLSQPRKHISKQPTRYFRARRCARWWQGIGLAVTIALKGGDRASKQNGQMVVTEGGRKIDLERR
jgi:hypothetical protein